METIERAKLATDYHQQGYNCAQAVACAYTDVIGLPVEQIAALTGTFGGGFRAGEICGALGGGALVLGARWPHTEPRDMKAKSFVSKKMMELERRFLERFPAMRCREIRDLPVRLEASPAAAQLNVNKSCQVYIAAVVEILDEMLAEG